MRSALCFNRPMLEWLKSKNEAFHGRKPLEAIEHGEVDRVWQMMIELRDGSAL